MGGVVKDRHSEWVSKRARKGLWVRIGTGQRDPFPRVARAEGTLISPARQTGHGGDSAPVVGNKDLALGKPLLVLRWLVT